LLPLMGPCCSVEAAQKEQTTIPSSPVVPAACQAESGELVERLKESLKEQHLRLKDLPDTSSPEFMQVLHELGFSSALERVKVIKAVVTLRKAPSAEAPPEDTTKFDTWQYDEMTKFQKAEAKFVVKDFVKAMVHGRNFQLVSPGSGEILDAVVSLNKRVDTLTICEEAGKKETIADLCNILDVAAEPEPSLAVQLRIDGQPEICLLLPSEEERETFVNALGILSKYAQAPKASQKVQRTYGSHRSTGDPAGS